MMNGNAKTPGAGVATLVAVLIGVALIGGAGYEQLERTRDRERLPQVGRSVDIGGRTLNLFCSGAGAPAVIFESSTPRPGYSWLLIQRQIAKLTQACWYDRAGLGWSDLGPYPRTSASGAQDLHALLQAAGVPPPYLLVAETLASFDALVFTGVFPAEVAGLVLVDGAHPDCLTRIPRIRGRGAPIQKYVGYPQNIAVQVFHQIGVLRLLEQNRPLPGPPPPGWTAEEWATLAHLMAEPRARVAFFQELPAVDQSSAQARAAGGLGNRPLVVISATHKFMLPDDQQVESKLQADLARLSTRGRQVTVELNDRFIQYQAPGVVPDAVRDVITNLR